MNEEQWTYRKKLDRIVIECNRKYKATLPKDAKDTFNALELLRHAQNGANASSFDGENDKKDVQRFAQDKLPEQPKQDTKVVDDMIKAFKEVHKA